MCVIVSLSIDSARTNRESPEMSLKTILIGLGMFLWGSEKICP